ncbi:zinc-dependent alcohol dehydrogenase [Petroclostridium xylanilyticum]|uniref:zinc-dependent alcohol dehydrogenase n=1 Tax=Petroclostridium xylanilyticum TaxID=1792311 RepID=UPI000B99CF4D|nr:zinc-binding alcohol dehydrogenase [Petroclostridium xylanilyticum]
MQSNYIEFTKKGVVQFKSENIDCNNLAPMEVILETETSIISAGTELARLYALEKEVTFPFRPGYGCIGRIVKKGSGIKNFNVGDRVFYAGKHASVQRFLHGEEHQWCYLFPVPEEIDAVHAAVACMAQIAITAPNITKIRLGDSVVVFGLGTVGILAALMYKMKGANVIGVDPVKERCIAAEKAGVDTVVDVESKKQVDIIMQMTKGKGADVAVDAVGHTGVIKNCIQSTAVCGQVILLGSPRVPFETDANDIFWDIHIKNITVRGAHMWQFPVRVDRGNAFSVEWNYDTIFKLIRNHKLPVDKIISHVIKPEKAPDAYAGLYHNPLEYLCVVIDWR